jgi:hypothetical protein
MILELCVFFPDFHELGLLLSNLFDNILPPRIDSRNMVLHVHYG